MKVLIIYPDIQTIQFYHFQHGIAWLSAVLKEAGHKVELFYINQELLPEEVVERVRSSGADLVGFSTTTLQYQFAREYARAIKRELKVPLVIGGIHATIDPESVMRDGVFDFLIRGEGEYPLLELADCLERGQDFRGILNLFWKEGDELKFNPVRPPVDLDSLPFPDREVFDERRLLLENDNQVIVMASRGCPFACSYCCNTVLSQLAGGTAKWLRRRSVENVIKEIDLIHQRYPEMKSIMFLDEVFTNNKRWIRDFCEEYKSRFRTPFRAYIHIDTVDYEVLKLMRDAGLYSVLIGVESGDEGIRREVMNRKMTNEDIIRVFRFCDELGIETWSLNMIGVPGDNEESIRRTIELNKILFPSHLQLSIFQPFPGTPLYDRCLKEGLLREERATTVFLYQPRLNLPGISMERFQELFEEFRALGWLWEAKKGARGYLDLSAEFDRARISEGRPGFVMLWLVRIRGEDRISILIHPESSVSYNLKLRKNSVLKFGAGFSPDVWDKPGGGCYYVVKVKPGFGREETVFSKYIDPKHNKEERRWLDFEVDLRKFGERRVLLKLETRVDNGNEYCVAFWSRPHLVQGGG